MPFIEINCFIPNCKTNLIPYQISLNYIIQCFYRLKNRKGHETLDFQNTQNAHLIFLSFLTLFMKMKFQNLEDLNIYFYGISITDENHLDFDNNFDFVLNFMDIMKKIKASPFKMEKLNEINVEILDVLEKMQIIFPQELFIDTRLKISEEIRECIFNFNYKFFIINKFNYN